MPIRLQPASSLNLHRSQNPILAIAALMFVAMAALVAPAHAQSQRSPDAGVACMAERRELAAAEQKTQTCVRQQAVAQRAANECSEDLERSERQIKSATAALEAAREDKGALCVASGALVLGVLDGRTPLPSIGECTSSEAAKSLNNLVSSWQNASVTLGQFVAWSSGESDDWPASPASGPGPSPILRRLLGGRNEAPLPYRRLLMEAVRLVAPRFLRQLRSGGSGGIESWLTSRAELEAPLVSEAEAVLAARGSGMAPRQSEALRLVQSFEQLVKCNDRTHIRECARARKLRAFLESSAPLIVRQRTQEIWIAACADIEGKTVHAWLRDPPVSALSVGQADWDDIVSAAYDKLVSCYLAEPATLKQRFPQWLAERLPEAKELTTRSLQDVDRIRTRHKAGSLQAACLDTVHTLRGLPTPTECSLADPAPIELRQWFEQSETAESGADGIVTQACALFVRALWGGDEARVLGSYPGAPTAQALVRVDPDDAFRATRTLRVLCDARAGNPQNFPASLRNLAQVAAAASEDVSASPWRLDTEARLPRETIQYAAASSVMDWVTSRIWGESACDALDLPVAICRTCTQGRGDERYDCSLLRSLTSRWRSFQRLSLLTGGGLVALVVGFFWILRLTRSLRKFGAWRRELRGHLVSMGLPVAPEALRFVFPSRMASLSVKLPDQPAWERWGKAAVITRADIGNTVTARDVTRAALNARAEGAELAILCHQEGASPDLAAVRAILDWAARGPRKAMQILPLSVERLRWIRSGEDLLDLIEQTSLRGNPFEVRGRLVSSSQFFNRERLVSGLISSCEAGNWTIVTGLRRFGKSSLALEVARRLQGAYAYVDLAGFHHEVSSSDDPSSVADGILRYVCEQLHESALKVYGSGVTALLPSPPSSEQKLDAGTLSHWLRTLVSACRKASGDRPVNLLLILDEVEQAIGVGPSRIGHAVDVLSVLVGRLRAVLNDTQMVQGGDRVGVLFCSALHPLLWAPLTTLSNQSLLGAFPSVFVPRLPEEAAEAMMRGLGARQGIRFADPALALIIRETQGIPILVRRIGSSILELYDPERARQGGLGAVDIGVEGATAAIRREEEDGAPLRVWVESEIADIHNPAGVLLRDLAVAGQLSISDLREKAATITLEQFEATGIAALLGPQESRRRAAEAAGYIVRMLGEIGILEPKGGQLEPDGYAFPESVVRRILSRPRRDSLMGF